MNRRRGRNRLLQIVTGIHRIHHIHWSYGYKIPLIGLGRFDKHGWKFVWDRKYHNCTVTGVY